MDLKLPLKYSDAQEEIFFNTPEKFNIIAKGRRFGLTQGAAQAFIEFAIEGETLLWGDTISSNITKYYERYFLPVLNYLPNKLWKWRVQDKELRIGKGVIDFRSADRPENWEGFGYDRIFLNEAGIILKNPYLLDNAVLPMMMDNPKSILYAGGVPKGKRSGKTESGKHRFFELWENDSPGYRKLRYTGYDNPFLDPEQVDLIAEILDDNTAKQEIWGLFIDVAERPFLYNFVEDVHVNGCELDESRVIRLSWDFNLDPFSVLVYQKIDEKTIHVVDFIKESSDVPQVCDRIISDYGRREFIVTGDASGKNRVGVQRGKTSYWKEVTTALNVPNRKDRILLRGKNLDLLDSKIICNAALKRCNISISSKCVDLISDCKMANVDEYGILVKDRKENKNDFLDAFRYLLDAEFPDIVVRPKKYA